ncbi:MAG TPA: hydroxymethylglutaryl-CoA reductase, degradative [Kofleriaceae bacterium]|nr:hydroxymethylglutaryl-CoA reductase, degradative [Kofleriaceae bacterium]
MSDARSSRIPGFYKLGVAGRRRRIAELCGLDDAALRALDGGLDAETADHMVENVIGTYALPLGIATNFTVDGTDYVVPMVIEEPSVIAAASNAAKMVRAGGGFHTRVSAPVMIGQIQLCEVADPPAAAAAIEAARDRLLQRAAALAPRLVDRGGGPVGLRVRTLSGPGDADGGMLVVHILVDCRDAMGANLVNSIAEGLADELAALARARVGLRILSNLSDERMVHVRARVPDAALDAEHGAAVRTAIAAASRFAELDPYRAATHNKGIMNGIDAVLLATGQDWRGVEAGAHAYACRDGAYRPLAVWRADGDGLAGELALPLAAGTVGGALHVHAGARLALALLGVASAQELAAVVAAAGLAANLAALRALATDGIQRGHMSLHARVVARAAGATGDEIEALAEALARCGEVKTERARALLEQLRAHDVKELP